VHLAVAREAARVAAADVAGPGHELEVGETHAPAPTRRCCCAPSPAPWLRAGRRRRSSGRTATAHRRRRSAP
jgi:hypothetical protein